MSRPISTHASSSSGKAVRHSPIHETGDILCDASSTSDDDNTAVLPPRENSPVSNHVSMRRRARRRKRFGLRMDPRYVVGRAADPSDYEQKYTEDNKHAEVSPNARVWRTYLDESQMFDTEMVEDSRDTVDVLLVFAGLFSAVVTTFVVQTSQQLQIDFAEISASLLFELVLAQRSSSNESIHDASPFSSFPFDPSVQFSPDRASTWINGLWFTSLTLSLVTALIAVLVKQWLHQYMSISSGTPRDRSLVRQYRYIGLQAWHVPLIIGLLPVLMHVALALFFLGLALFLSPLNLTIALIVGSLSCATYLAYAATHILPICFPQCPYKTPLSNFGRKLSVRLFPHFFTAEEQPRSSEISANAYVHIVEALRWLYTTSSNSTVRNVVLQSLGGMPARFSETFATKSEAAEGLTHDCKRIFEDAVTGSTGADPVALGNPIETRALWKGPRNQNTATMSVDEHVVMPDLQNAERLERLLRYICSIYDQPLGETLRATVPLEKLKISDSSGASFSPELQAVVAGLSSHNEHDLDTAMKALMPYISPSCTQSLTRLHPSVWIRIVGNARDIIDWSFTKFSLGEIDVEWCNTVLLLLAPTPDDHLVDPERVDLPVDFCGAISRRYIREGMTDVMLLVFAKWDSHQRDNREVSKWVRLVLAVIYSYVTHVDVGTNFPEGTDLLNYHLFDAYHNEPNKISLLRTFLSNILILARDGPCREATLQYYTPNERFLLFDCVRRLVESSCFGSFHLDDDRTLRKIHNMALTILCDITLEWVNDDCPDRQLYAADPQIGWFNETLLAALLNAPLHSETSRFGDQGEHYYARGEAGPLRAACGLCVQAFRLNVPSASKVLRELGMLGYFQKYLSAYPVLSVVKTYISWLSNVTKDPVNNDADELQAQLDYLFCPDNLRTVCAVLAFEGVLIGFRIDVDITSLIEIRPVKTLWEECMEGLRRPVNDNNEFLKRQYMDGNDCWIQLSVFKRNPGRIMALREALILVIHKIQTYFGDAPANPDMSAYILPTLAIPSTDSIIAVQGPQRIPIWPNASPKRHRVFDLFSRFTRYNVPANGDLELDEMSRQLV